MMPFPPPLPADDRPRRVRLVAHARAATDALALAVETVGERGHDLEVHVSSAAGDAIAFAEEAARGGAETVVAAGGDGTVHEVVAGLVRAGLPATCSLGVVPAGTANDFAAAAGIPTGDPLAALELALSVPAVAMDLGELNGAPFLNAACGGFGAELTARTSAEMKQWLGGGAYLLTGLTSPGAVAPRFVRLRGPDFTWSGELYVLAVGKRPADGGRLQAVPAGADRRTACSTCAWCRPVRRRGCSACCTICSSPTRRRTSPPGCTGRCRGWRSRRRTGCR